MLKRIALFLSVCAGLTLAQAAPSLKYQGFDGTWISYGDTKAGFRQFELRVDYDPYHFVYKGEVNAGPVTSDLGEMEEDVGVVVTYFDQPVKDSKGTAQVVAYQGVVFFVDDQPVKIQNGAFQLLPPSSGISGVSAITAKVPGWYTAYEASASADDLASQEESDVTTALADPWNKEVKDTEAAGQKIAEERRRKDSIATVQAEARHRADSLAALAELRKKQDAEKAALVAAAAAEKNKVKKSQKKKKLKQLEQESQATAQKQEALQAETAAAAADATAAPATKVRKKKKKQPTAEEQEESAKSASKMDDPEFRKKLGWSLVGIGGVAFVYGILQHQKMNKELTSHNDFIALRDQFIAAGDGLQATVADQQANDHLDAKNKAESNRNLGLLVSAIGIGGGVVVLRW